MEIEFGIRFVITRCSTGRFGAGVVAIDLNGARLAPPAPLVDPVYSSPEESAEIVLGLLRGAVQMKRASFSRDELGIRRLRTAQAEAHQSAT